MNMEETRKDIEIDGKATLGALLKAGRLFVPPNQRDYSWKDKHISDLYSDLKLEIAKGAPEYFLGSIVVIKTSDNRLMIVDGQQRLTTSLILLAAIRDYLAVNDDAENAGRLQREFLLSDEFTSDSDQHLQLNTTDDQYFYERVILPKSDQRRKNRMGEKPTKATHKSSHLKINRAAILAEEAVKNIVQGHRSENKITELSRWVKFLLHGAKVILVIVPNESSAYLIFETMNDRGLALSATDLIKNFLLGKAGNSKIEIVKQNWAQMTGALETVGDAEVVKAFVRHFWISRNGKIRGAELFLAIKDSIKSSDRAVQLSAELAASALLYAALLNPSHSMWTQYGAFADDARKGVAFLKLLGVSQIRPLLLSALIKFKPKEVSILLKKSVAWAVRLTFAGIQGTGELETIYGAVPEKIFKGELKTANDVAKFMQKDIPKDAQFLNDFAEAKVSRADLARWYLRSLERAKQGDPKPYYVPNDETIINLEHILPKDSDTNWSHIPRQDREDYLYRLGNQVLLLETENSLIGNESFAVKKPVLATAEFKLTNEIGTYSDWTVENIEARQVDLAKLAVKTWSIK